MNRRDLTSRLLRHGLIGTLAAQSLLSCGQSARHTPTAVGGAEQGQSGAAPAAPSAGAAGSRGQHAGSSGGSAGATGVSSSGGASGEPTGEGGASGEACACPLGDDCEPAAAKPCFEPCGGEPFGIWTLEDACFAGGTVDGSLQGCQRQLRASPGANQLTLRILDGGQLDLQASEEWTLGVTATLACFVIESSDRCKDATYWHDSLLFSSSVESSCVANGCGACDCEVAGGGYVGGGFYDWRRSGNQLILGGTTTDYCVEGDELWLSGQNADGSPTVSYKFRKHSCVGTPVPCAQRSESECALSASCAVGHCAASAGTDSRCEAIVWQPDCIITEGCEWRPDGCTGTPYESCSYDSCDVELGCSWGEPRARCGGTASRCQNLAECAGPGCLMEGDNCFTLVDCTALSADQCHSEPGCRLEW